MRRMFQCTLCKKHRLEHDLRLTFKDGTHMCKVCAIEIENSFSYYVDGKKVTRDEYKKRRGR